MVSVYSESYQRLRLRYYTDSNGINQELKLPFCETIDNTDFNNNITIKKFKSGSLYSSTHIKRIERRSPMTLKGIIMDDIIGQSELSGINVSQYKTLQQYIDALMSLQSIINFTFDTIGGTMVIDEIIVDSEGEVRNYEIRGSRIC